MSWQSNANRFAVLTVLWFFLLEPKVWKLDNQCYVCKLLHCFIIVINFVWNLIWASLAESSWSLLIIGNPIRRLFVFLYLQNVSDNLNLTWNKASWGGTGVQFVQLKGHQGTWSRHCENTMKTLTLQNRWTHFNQMWHKAYKSEGDKSLFKQRGR